MRMKCYRFKHIPTGMYWRPTRTVRKRVKPNKGETVWMMVKSNLSKTGKIYANKPRWEWIKWGFYDHLIVIKLLESNGPFSSYYLTSHVHPFIQSEWELEEL